MWTDLDRILSDTGTDEENERHFYATMSDLVIPHLSMVFHRYLEKSSTFELKVGMTSCKPWDPFMSKHQGTHEVAAEKYSDKKINDLERAERKTIVKNWGRFELVVDS